MYTKWHNISIKIGEYINFQTNLVGKHQHTIVCLSWISKVSLELICNMYNRTYCFIKEFKSEIIYEY